MRKLALFLLVTLFLGFGSVFADTSETPGTPVPSAGSETPGREGISVLVFVAQLYALRGAAVLLVIGGAPGPMGWVLVFLVGLLLHPLVMIAMFALGVSDTWLDLRTRQARTTPDA